MVGKVELSILPADCGLLSLVEASLRQETRVSTFCGNVGGNDSLVVERSVCRRGLG